MQGFNPVNSFIKEKNINGGLYSIALLPTGPGMGVFKELTKTFGDSIGVAVDSIIANDMDIHSLADNDFFTSIMIAITSKLDDFKFVELVQNNLLNGLYYNGEIVNFDDHFRGKFDELVEVIFWAMQINYGSVFTKLLKARGLDVHTLRSTMSQAMGQKSNESKETSKD